RGCADCHDPGHGFSDRETLSRDDLGPTKRHSQTLVDGAANPSGHWDGEFKRIDDLVRARLAVRFDSGEARYGRGDESDSGDEMPLHVVSASDLVKPRSMGSGRFDLADKAAIVDEPETSSETEGAGTDVVDVMPATKTADELFGARG